MAIDFKSPAEAVLEQGIKCLIYGAAGSGKTVTCVTTNEPTLIVSTEAGLLSIKDAPKNIQIVECNTREDVGEVLDYLVKNGPPAWVCLDSVSEIAEVVLADALSKTKDGRKAYGELAVAMTSLIKKFRDLHCNVVMTSKVDRIKDELTGAMLYGPGMPGQRLGQQLPYLFDLVGALRVSKGQDDKLERTIQTNLDDQWQAKDRSGKLEMFERPNLAMIRNKILGLTPTPVAKKKAA